MAAPVLGDPLVPTLSTEHEASVLFEVPATPPVGPCGLSPCFGPMPAATDLCLRVDTRSPGGYIVAREHFPTRWRYPGVHSIATVAASGTGNPTYT
jgi:hypothetical protein